MIAASVISLLLHWLFPYDYPEVTELEREQEILGVEPEGESSGLSVATASPFEKKRFQAAVRDVEAS